MTSLINVRVCCPAVDAIDLNGDNSLKMKGRKEIKNKGNSLNSVGCQERIVWGWGDFFIRIGICLITGFTRLVT